MNAISYSGPLHMEVPPDPEILFRRPASFDMVGETVFLKLPHPEMVRPWQHQVVWGDGVVRSDESVTRLTPDDALRLLDFLRDNEARLAVAKEAHSRRKASALEDIRKKAGL